MSNIDAMAADLFDTISAYIDKRVAAVTEKMVEMQTKLDAYAKEDEGCRDAMLKWTETTETWVAQLLSTVAEIKALPKAKDGQPGTDGKDGDPGKDAQEVDYSKVERYVETHVNSAMATTLSALPKAKDGADGIDGKDGAPGKDAPSVDIPALVKTVLAEVQVPKDGAKGEDGEDGRDGRDAIQCDVLDIVDPERRYQRGTYAKHRGGRIRAFRATDPMGDGPLEKFGWTVDLEGVAEVGVTQGDDMRSFAVGVELTSGKSFVQKFSMPVVLDRGKFEREQSYAKGDSVSWDGSAWIAQKDIESAGDKPLPPDWRLSIKRGQDGKDLRTEEAPRVREPLRLR